MAVNFFRYYRCLSVDHASTTEHAMKIRQHYVYLLDALDTKYSGLLDELFSAKVCKMLVWWAVLAVCLLLPDQSQQWNLPAPNLVTWWLWGAMIRHWFWLQKSRRSRPKYTSEFENLCPFGPCQGSSAMVDCVKFPPIGGITACGTQQMEPGACVDPILCIGPEYLRSVLWKVKVTKQVTVLRWIYLMEWVWVPRCAGSRMTWSVGPVAMLLSLTSDQIR